jgi:hypothetical protein
MRQINAARAATLAPRLTIVHQVTGQIEPLRLNRSQRRVLRALQRHARVIVLKPRQAYISTVCCLYALLFAMANPGVKVALVADIREKAEGLLQKASSWAREMGVPTAASNTKRLVLWNGAELHAITANSADVGSAEVKAGRSFSYGLIILSEFAYYNRDAALLASLTRSALAGARIIIESTATPAENAFASIWKKGKGWHRVPIMFEEHEAYQLAATEIDDERFAELQALYGFTSRTHAAYWNRMVETDLNGDVYRGLREAPIKPEHAFSFAEGRWIFVHEETEPQRFEGRPGSPWTFADDIDGGWRIYDAVDDSGCIMSIDTASGVGADASAIAIIGRRRGNLIATFVARNVIVPDLIEIAKAAAERWKPYATVVEGNGIGKGVYQALGLVSVAHATEHTSQDPEKPLRMNLVKIAIESGQIAGGPELQFEVAHSEMLRPTRPKGAPVWDGPDDLLNAIGFALVFRNKHPWRESMRKINTHTHIDRRTIHMRARGAKVF